MSSGRSGICSPRASLARVTLRFTAALLLGGALFSPQFCSASASNGRSPAGSELRTVIRALPYTISSPGSYVVGSALTCPSSSLDGITIAASHVTLDLGGCPLTGAGPGSSRGIVVTAGQQNVCVRNGSVVAWGENGLSAGVNSSVLVEDFTASACGGDGISLHTGELRRCRAERNARNGVVTGAGAADGSVNVALTDCVAENNRMCGTVHKRPGKCKYKNIVLRTNGQHGALFEGGTATDADIGCGDSICVGNGGCGILLEMKGEGYRIRCKTDGCTFADNGSHGFSVAAQAPGFYEGWPARSAFSGNGGDGLNVTIAAAAAGMNFTAQECQFLRNKGQGACILSTGKGSTANARCVDCDFTDNGGTGVSIDTREKREKQIADCIAAIERCRCVGNGGSGALLAHEAAHVVQSRSSGNALDGFRVEDCDDADFADCQAIQNGGVGFRIRCKDATCARLLASSNGSTGLDQDCDGSGWADEIRATGNGEGGIRFRCAGPVSISRCDASHNQGIGIGGDCDDADVDRCVAAGNSDAGLDLTCRGALRLSSSSATSNQGTGARCVCSSGWTAHSSFSRNKGTGLDLVAADGATVSGNVVVGNGSSGIRYVGSYGDVSNNRCSGNTGNALDLDGEHNRIAGNVLTRNGRAVSSRTGVNPLFENVEGANLAESYEEVPNDRAPTSPASKATSPFSNIQAP